MYPPFIKELINLPGILIQTNGAERERQAKRRLDAWIHRNLFGPCSAVHAIANALVKRTDEIISCILLPYSDGRMEETNHKIKLIKRQEYRYRNIQRFALWVRLEMSTTVS